MYYGQVMLMLVLKVKRNDSVTLSKHKSITEKETKKQEITMYFLFLELCGIV